MTSESIENIWDKQSGAGDTESKQSFGVQEEEKKALLTRYFRKVTSKLSTIELNITDSDVSPDINQLFVSVPTNIQIGVKVEGRGIVEILENGIQYQVGAPSNKYKSCVAQFNEIILNNALLYTNAGCRPLICRPYWKDGVIYEFLWLKPIDIISANQYSIVLGGPGSGKSTLLKYLTILLSKQYFFDENILKNDTCSTFFFEKKYIPVYVQLRQYFGYLGREEISAESLIDFIFDNSVKFDNDIFSHDDKKNFLMILKSCPIILFFDGIDEIFTGNETYQKLKKLVEIAKGLAQEANLKVVFSSRKESYQWDLTNFTQFELRPMDVASQHILAQKVLEAVGVQDFYNKLKILIEQIDHCGLDEKIVGNPLFLSLMVVIYARTGNLPRQKSLVLQKSIKFLIKRWQDKIHQQASMAPYELIQLYTALKQIAAKTFEEVQIGETSNPLIINEGIILSVLKDLISQDASAMYAQVENKVQVLLKCLVESVGVIVPSQSRDCYEFAHRHFQEYLVASSLVDQADLLNNFSQMVATKQDGRFEIYFMIIEILLDQKNHTMIWTILQTLLFVDEYSAEPEDDGLRAWKIWFCCKVIRNRNYTLLATIFKDRQQHTKETILTLNHCVNELITESDLLGLSKRIECAQFLGEVRDKLLEVNKELKESNRDIYERFILPIADELGDRRAGVGLNVDGLPDILWCEIKEGSFHLGLSDDEAKKIIEENADSKLQREMPQAEIQVGKFKISKYPITFAQYQAFVKDGAYTKETFWEWSDVSKQWFKDVGSKKEFTVSNVSNAPVVDISWIEAVGFCQWLSKKLNATIRLPYEFEWEYVAKRHFKRYAYSETFDKQKYVSSHLGLNQAAPVGVCRNDLDNGKYPSDLTGNVWEWTQTVIPQECENLEDYIAYMPQRNVKLPSNSIDKNMRIVVRGGSFLNGSFQSRNTYRGRDYLWNHITLRQSFRVVEET